MPRVYDHDVIQRCALALAVQLRPEWLAEDWTRKPAVMFIGAPARSQNARRDLARLARRERKDVVMLRFEPGTERQEPTGVSVYLHRGPAAAWQDCDFWIGSNETPALVSHDGTASFLFNGIELLKRNDGPVGAELAEGLARARLRLRNAIRNTDGIDLSTARVN